MSRALRLFACIILLSVTAPYLSSSTETTFHNFAGGSDGSDPVADLLYDPTTGMVYGTTKTGGAGPNCANGCGTVFSIHSNGTGYTVIYRFTGGANDGANPAAGLTIDGQGNLYGTTSNGGPQHVGTIFKLTALGGGKFRESILHSFAGADGAHPLSRLALDTSGALYGTTFGGGANGLGTVFVLQSGIESVIFSFTGGNGSHPRAGVVLDTAGNLWGTTAAGGSANLGVVFRLTFNGNIWKESFRHGFSGADGAHPFAALTLDDAGDVFGTTKAGGSPTCTFATAGCGVVFEFQPAGTGFTESTIYTFTGGADGAAPIADVTMALDAFGAPYLYGTASEAGVIGGACPATGCGTVFELCGIGSSCQGSQTWTEYTLFEFVGRNGGRTPAGSVLAFLPVGANADPWDFPPGGKAKCTSGCMAAPSSGGSSGDGTLDGFTN
jgi:uncharacterized repeat protein (TIGR03803 family)